MNEGRKGYSTFHCPQVTGTEISLMKVNLYMRDQSFPLPASYLAKSHSQATQLALASLPPDLLHYSWCPGYVTWHPRNGVFLLQGQEGS